MFNKVLLYHLCYGQVSSRLNCLLYMPLYFKFFVLFKTVLNNSLNNFTVSAGCLCWTSIKNIWTIFFLINNLTHDALVSSMFREYQALLNKGGSYAKRKVPPALAWLITWFTIVYLFNFCWLLLTELAIHQCLWNK